VLLFSQRARAPLISRCFSYELEDAIAAMDAVDLVSPGYRHGLGELVYRVVNKAGRGTSLLRGLNPAVRRTPIQRRYPLFFAVFQFATDLPTLNALGGWRERSEQAVCLIEELWAQDLTRFASQLAILRRFDQVLTNCRSTVEPLAERIGRPVHYIPPGIDAPRFFPGERPPGRCIDIHNLGRRHPATHAALLDYSRSRGRFYLYDTLQGNLPVQDPVQHRELLAEKLKRTVFFIANKAKVNEGGERGTQEEVGFRFFEGAAAGTVLIGDPPDVASFHENFDWPDAVVRLPYGSGEVAELLDGLLQDPERLARIRAANIRHSLQRHDWANRWQQILDLLGLEPLPALGARRERLRRIAATLP
jgi:glycosyltransferase involved in cell wall biosynthesis